MSKNLKAFLYFAITIFLLCLNFFNTIPPILAADPYSDTDNCRLLSPTGDISYPNNQSLPISFQGKRNTNYGIRTKQVDQIAEKAQGVVTTNNTGRGDATISLSGYSNNAKVRIYIQPPSGYVSPRDNCAFTVTISPEAPTIAPLGAPPPGATIVPPLSALTPSPAAVSAAGAAGEPCKSGKPGVETAIGCVPFEPQQLVQGILRWAAGLGGGIALLLMIFGALQMITSSGNPDGIKAGQERFVSAIIGLLFIIFAVFLLQIIGADILNIQDFGK